MLLNLQEWDGKNTEALISYYQSNRKSENWNLMLEKIFESEDPLVIKAGSWLFKYDLEHGELKKYIKTRVKSDIKTEIKTESYLSNMTHALILKASESDDWEVTLHLLQILKYVDIPSAQEETLKSIVDQSLVSEIKFVRAWAYDGLYRLMLHNPVYQADFERVIGLALNTEKGAVMARIRYILKEDQR